MNSGLLGEFLIFYILEKKFPNTKILPNVYMFLNQKIMVDGYMEMVKERIGHKLLAKAKKINFIIQYGKIMDILTLYQNI